ncbi:autotransporter outer membrane beta-barrel domain-containing protein [Pseudomonas putida]|uniref:Pertactin autotransporter n=1 Tax=Pseudomonas putida TaxID=303 RepID=A0A1Q9QZE2_PSEPU|nr:autotransporter outer membrane beta-barrel domain-containing protein [Pseudomonas putida]OLS60513.1 Pertactin autotransporter precursor [Pseudomonas putida]
MKTHNASTTMATPRHPPHRLLPIAMVVAALISGSAMAADYSTPLRFDNQSSVSTLVRKQVDVTSANPAISLQGLTFAIDSVSVRNASGTGIDMQAAAALMAQSLNGLTLGSAAPVISISGASRADLVGPGVLQTSGGRSPVVLLRDGELHLVDMDLRTLGVLSPGVDMGANATLNVARGSIETFEMSSAGIREVDNTQAGVVNGTLIHTHKAESAGVLASNSSGLLSLEGTGIFTEGASSDGVNIQQKSRVDLLGNSTVHTLGERASALRATTGSSIRVADGSLLTEGRYAAAARVASDGVIELERSQVLATGSSAAALGLEGASRISLANSSVGNLDGSTVVFEGSSQAPGVGYLQLRGSHIAGPQALFETQPGSQGLALLDDSDLISSQGTSFLVGARSELKAQLQSTQVSAVELARVNGDGRFDLTARNSELRGDTLLQAPGSGMLDMDLDNSRWMLKGSSAVSNLSLTNSDVMFGGSNFEVLTVHGDLSGSGRFLMKTDLSSTQGDLLSVQGSVSGQHELMVADSGHDANGAPLKVVASSGGAGTFSLLGGHVDAGAYRYGLQRQGSDWYLAETGQIVPIQSLAPARPYQAIPTPMSSNVAMTALNPSLPAQSVPTPLSSTVAMTALNPSLPAQSVPTPVNSNVAMTALNPSLPAQSVPTPVSSNVAMTALNPSLPAQSVPTPVNSNVAMTTLNPSLPAQSVPTPVSSNVAMTALNPSLPAQSVPTPVNSNVAMTSLNPSLPAQSVPTPVSSNVAMTALNPSLPAQSVPTPVSTNVAMATLTPSQPNQSVPHLPQNQRLSKGANAALGMQTAAAGLWHNEMGTLNRRLGELRLGEDEGGLWARAMTTEQHLKANDSRAFDQNINGTQLGADAVITDGNGRLYVGGMLGAARSEQDFGERSKGVIDSRSVGLYTTWIGDTGLYVDTVVKYDHLDGQVKVTDNLGHRVRGRYDGNAYGASVEVGRQFVLGDGWFVEPQAQISAVHLDGPHYTSSDGLKVDAQAQESVEGRLGGRAGRDFIMENGSHIQSYISVSQIEELAGKTHVTVDGHQLENSLPGARTDYGLGTTVQLSERQKVMLEVHYEQGPKIEQPLEVTVGYRILW